MTAFLLLALFASTPTCYAISDMDVIVSPEGWLILKTGEWFTSENVLLSDDGKYRRCSANGDDEKRTQFFYVPDVGT